MLAAMLEQAKEAPFEEVCGMLAGRDGVITHIFPAENELHSAREFAIPPRELFRVFHSMRTQRLDHLGIYHSHPATENAPSQRDIEESHYPEAAYFIVSPRPAAERPVRAFLIQPPEVTELELEIV